MTDHKVSHFMTKKSYHAVTLVSNYPVKATSDTVCLDPFLLFQKLITAAYRCAKVWAMCLSHNTIWGYCRHAAIQQSISSACHPDEYHVPMWRLILNKIWVNVVLHGHFQNHLSVNMVKLYISFCLDNGEFNLLLSFVVTKYHVFKVRMGLEILCGFCGPAIYTAAMFVPR